MQRLIMALALTLLAQFALAASAVAAVNINTASLDEFVALHKGLGPAKAQAIIDYRKANGPFKTVDDLRHVKGIGAKRLEKLRPELTVGSTAKVASASAAKGDAKVASTSAAKGDAKAVGVVAKGDIRPAADTVRK
jgi:competence protein ComEA